MAWSKIGLYKYKGRNRPWLVRWFGEIDPATGKQRRYSKSFERKAEAEDFRDKKKAEFRSGQ
jgi:hypothetical protein